MIQTRKETRSEASFLLETYFQHLDFKAHLKRIELILLPLSNWIDRVRFSGSNNIIIIILIVISMSPTHKGWFLPLRISITFSSVAWSKF